MQKQRLLLLIVLSILCFAMTVSAAEPAEKAEAPKWEVIAETKEGDATFIDVASIVDGPEGSKEAWFLMEYKTPDCTSEYAKSQKKMRTEHRRIQPDLQQQKNHHAPVSVAFYRRNRSGAFSSR